MVDARPLLFVNALALMLMVTAGFASIRQDASSVDEIAEEPGVCYRDKSYRATQCPQLEGW